MKNCETFIHHILNTSNDELLLKYWRQKLQQTDTKKNEPLPFTFEMKKEIPEAVLVD